MTDGLGKDSIVKEYGQMIRLDELGLDVEVKGSWLLVVGPAETSHIRHDLAVEDHSSIKV
jgi:hypothetical protein